MRRRRGGDGRLLPHLPNGRRVVLPGFGHSTSFFADQPAGTHLINTYLASGEVDDSRYEPQRVDFTPEVTQTALGKGVGGAIVGFALLTVLSLLWMAGLVRRRGGFGRKASATLRSVYPVVLGLGGWFMGVLIVVTTMPGVPLDDELLAVLSVGVPIGLGIYWAWVPRDGVRPDQDRGIRGGTGRRPRRRVARVQRDGASGAHHRDRGATVGANLLLIALDIARARSLRDRPAAPASSPVPSGSGA